MGEPVLPLFSPLFPTDESLPIHCGDMDVLEMGMRQAAELNRKWHSMLPRTDLGNLLCGSTSVAYGALHQDVWYATAIWTQPIIQAMCDGHTIELRRFAIDEYAPRNTASWMLARMRKMLKAKWPHLRRLISYLAVDVHDGTIYKASGWQPIGKIVNARPQRFSNVNRNTRATGPLQTTSRKQRWELMV